ncbi:GNAT family N-acetyltransferase [Anaerocolumna sp. AGMB13020]|uniref:GNAT family N-acetyltransferase n=1 Tax=Anaerocolumna sp. AGMB13020 TaxID=3081750 RepID=UPI002953C9EE|nr:GNAT family N-acetyltransferase [Anaerocolumna sp. AGMB13020]WOO37597.1 GNAT family N-acetyltransferase [Anaerocolumna sp. AGMB13020]
MEITTIRRNSLLIAFVQEKEIVIKDIQSALDLLATVWYETGSNYLIITKESITEDFFVLSTRLAGEILQKFINYNIKVAITGDYSGYTSKPLKDFIYECNNGKDIFFLSTIEEAIDKFTQAFNPVRLNAGKFHGLGDDTIGFKALNTADAAAIHEYASDPEVSRYIGWRLMKSQDETYQHVETMIKRETELIQLYASVYLRETGEIIGTVMLFHMELEAANAEIGYVFRKDAWGKGYGSRSIALISDFVFNTLKFHRLYANVAAENVGSGKILLKNGFLLEGRLKDHYLVEERYCDRLIYGKLATI